MGLFLTSCHKLICIAVSLCKHVWKSVCDIKKGTDPCPLLAWSYTTERDHVKPQWKFHIIFTWDFTWYFTNYVKKCCGIFMWKSCGNHVKRVFPFTWCFTLLKSMKKMSNRQRWVGDPWVWNYKWKLSIPQYIINRYNKIREEPTGSIEPMP